MIAQSTVDRIFDAAIIEEVIGEFVHLKKSGASYKGLSPWTNEKTPSFHVVPSKGIFKDFSSGKGGNVVAFLMEHERMTYPEALKYLAAKYQIEVEETGVSEEERANRDVRESLALVNDFALKHFRDNLHASDEGKAIALSYFRERGYTDQTIEKFALGYAIDRGDTFLKTAEAAGHKLEFLVALGLVKEGNRGHYDFFHGRVIFPIRNASGKCIAFAGRTLKSKDKVKYINSPENELYDKSRTLYGLFESKQAIAGEDMCYLVEGYTDVISLHQAGVQNAVASSGTSLTPGQAKLIKRYSKNVTILYDGDAAGINASLRGIDILLAEGLNVWVVLFPDGQDPDSFAGSVSQEELKRYLKEQARDFVDFIPDVLLKDGDDDPTVKSEVTRRVLESLAQIEDRITRGFYLKKCATRLEVEEGVLVSELNKILRREQIRRHRRGDHTAPEPIAETAKPQSQTADDTDPHALEMEIVRVLVKYGSQEFDLELAPSKEETEKTEEEKKEDLDFGALEAPQEVPTLRIKVAEYILHDMEADDMTFQSEVCAKIVEAFRTEFAETGDFPAVDKLLRDPDMNVAVADLISEPYQLSENWKAKHRIYTESEEDDLRRTVFDPLMRFKLRKIKEMMLQTDKAIQSTSEKEALEDLLREKIALDRMKSEIGAFFGTIIM